MESRAPPGAAPPSTQSATVKVTRCASCSTSSRPGSGRTESRCPSDSTRPSDSRKASSTVPQASTDTAPLERIRRPSRPLTTKPAKGSNGINQTSVSMTEVPSPLHQVHFVHVDRLPVPEKGDDDGQPHSHLGSGDGDVEHAPDLPCQVLPFAGEGDEIDVGCIQDQFDGHQDDDHVAADQDPHNSDGQKHQAENHEVALRDDHVSLVSPRLRPAVDPGQWHQSSPPAAATRPPRRGACSPGTGRFPSTASSLLRGGPRRRVDPPRP